jgi:nucleoside-diphosphate-sugar epimerase
MKRQLPILGADANAARERQGPLAGKTLVVTGASGFLGAHFVEHARGQGASVLAVVRARSPETETDAQLTRTRTTAEVLADPELLRGDAVVHLAAVRHRHGTSPSEYDSANCELATSLLRAAAGRAGRFVHVSSVGVYGFPPDLPVNERHPYQPVTDYSVSKVKAERLLARLAPELGIPLVIVRPTITYGPGDRNGMLDKLVAMIDRHRYLVVGRGDNLLHHTHVDDFVRGLSLAVSSPAALGEDFIVCGPETITLTDLSRQVADLLGRWLPPVHVPLTVARPVASLVERLAAARILVHGEPPLTQEKLDVMCLPIAFDGSKAARLLGFTPTVGYREGLARTIGARS